MHAEIWTTLIYQSTKGRESFKGTKRLLDTTELYIWFGIVVKGREIFNEIYINEDNEISI